MPAPAVYVLAVVGTISAAFALHQFVYKPHIAPKVEQWVEELGARRRNRRMQQEYVPIPVSASASIPLRRRRANDTRRSTSTLSESDHDTHRGNSGVQRGNNSAPTQTNSEFNGLVAREVNEWRSQAEGSRAPSGLRHRKNLGVHALDESINSIPHPPMSPTHVITDTSTPTTPSSTTFPSTQPSPPAQISPINPADSVSTLSFSVNNESSATLTTTTVRPTTISYPTLTRISPEIISPPSSSPIPSLSQSYPQELDQERGVELVSSPSSGTSSPFSTFSPFVPPQQLSPSPNTTIQQPQDYHTSSETSNYASFASSPAAPPSPPLSHLSSPVHVSDPLRDELSYLSSPSPVNFTSPHVASPHSPRSEISDLDFGSDVDIISEQGSEASWTGVSSHSGSSYYHH